ncbi:MAG TPA: hypothetical protein VFQ65_29305 [Kofleriaceae bacterium]|nr:hypothetical protein [Kofleriaceae bacterium]
METFAIVMAFAVIWIIAAAAKASGSASYTRLARSGTPARGILLAVASTPGTSVGIGLNKLQSRQVTIDIEVPGQPPYELTTTLLIPLNLVRDVLPGATVELRVGSRNQVVVVGPGVGFTASTLMTQGQNNQGAA